MTRLQEPSQEWGVSRRFGAGHNGVDYKYPSSTPVYAAADGVVDFEGEGKYHPWITWMGGTSILLKHESLYSGYSHLSSTVVNIGDRVRRGQLIGYSGSTGNSTGPHLHFDVLPLNPDFKNGYSGRIDPDRYFATNIKGGDMPDLVNKDTARILAASIGTSDGLDGRPNAHKGDRDVDLEKNIIGKELTNEFIRNWWASAEGAQKIAIINSAYESRNNALGKVGELEDELKRLPGDTSEAEKRLQAIRDALGIR
ncbi:M23 family metallopeptidase [Rhodococcus sp. NPDC004095]